MYGSLGDQLEAQTNRTRCIDLGGDTFLALPVHLCFGPSLLVVIALGKHGLNSTEPQALCIDWCKLGIILGKTTSTASYPHRSSRQE